MFKNIKSLRLKTPLIIAVIILSCIVLLVLTILNYPQFLFAKVKCGHDPIIGYTHEWSNAKFYRLPKDYFHTNLLPGFSPLRVNPKFFCSEYEAMGAGYEISPNSLDDDSPESIEAWAETQNMAFNNPQKAKYLQNAKKVDYKIYYPEYLPKGKKVDGFVYLPARGEDLRNIEKPDKETITSRIEVNYGDSNDFAIYQANATDYPMEKFVFAEEPFKKITTSKRGGPIYYQNRIIYGARSYGFHNYALVIDNTLIYISHLYQKDKELPFTRKQIIKIFNSMRPATESEKHIF